VQCGAIFLIEPVSRIERQKLDFGPFRQIGRLIDNQPAGFDSSLECHTSF
jgi:hypothetical protein